MKRECAEKCAPCLSIVFSYVSYRKINVLHPEVTLRHSKKCNKCITEMMCNMFKKKLWQKNIFGNDTGHTKLVTEVFAISYTSFIIETLYKLQNENETALQKCITAPLHLLKNLTLCRSNFFNTTKHVTAIT